MPIFYTFARCLPLAAVSLLLCAALTSVSATTIWANEISVQEARALLASPPEGLIILDVRTPEEFAQGRLAGARLMDFSSPNFEVEAATLPKDKPILLYCRTGNRSSKANEKLKKLGITNILHMDAGIRGWNNANFPVEK